MEPRSQRLAACLFSAVMVMMVTVAFADPPELVYLYDYDTVARDSYSNMLSGYFGFTSVAMADVATHDFSPHSLIIAGSDTGYAYDWGTAADLTNVLASQLPIIGLGRGGAALFHNCGLAISYGNCFSGSVTGIIAEEPTHLLWRYPIPIPINPDGSVVMYSSATNGEFLVMSVAPASVTCHGLALGEPGFCGIASEEWPGPFVVLWSMFALPDVMDAVGWDMFTNLIWYALDPTGMIFADGFESENTSEWSATTP